MTAACAPLDPAATRARRKTVPGEHELRYKRQKSARIASWPTLRMYAVAGVLSALFGLVGLRAFALQIAESARFHAAAERQHVGMIEIPAPRGAIVDTRGRELAIAVNQSSVWADPTLVKDVANSAETLAEILGGDIRDYEAKLVAPKRFIWLKRQAGEDLVANLRAAKLPGVRVAQEPRRFYPNQSVAGPIIGFVNIDGRGLEGLERSMDELLRGRKTQRRVVRDSRGGLMATAQKSAPLFGATVVLTLDRNLQFIAEEALRQAVLKHQAKLATAVVIEVKTGHVLAMANWPTFDPNQPSSRGKSRNRAIVDAYEIGSVMKTFTVAEALESGAVALDDQFDVSSGSILVGRKRIRDSYRDTILDVRGVLKRSSNVGTVQIAQALGKERLYRAIRRFGFGSRTGIELPGERAGVVHPVARWGAIGLATMSYGMGMTATSLQVAAAYAALGNQGLYNEPRLVKVVRDHSGVEIYRCQENQRRVLRASTAKRMLSMLASVFEPGRQGGTARKLVVEGYRAGGKTGTAHKYDPALKAYSDDKYLASFAGLAPIDNPRIAAVVVVDEPRGEEYYGAVVAGPAWATLVAKTLEYLGEPTTVPTPRAAAKSAALAPRGGVEAKEPGRRSRAPAAAPAWVEESPDSQPWRPDFSGLSMRRALALAANWGVELSITGSGVAVKQSPLAGMVATKGAAAAATSTWRVHFAPRERGWVLSER